MFVDSHCHLYDTRGVPVDDVIAAAHAAGVDTMITIGCDAATTAAAIDIATGRTGIHATAGLHPHEAVHGVDTIVPFLDHPEVIAVGETGLDYFYEHSPRDVQRTAFAAQIQLAHELGLARVILPVYLRYHTAYSTLVRCGYQIEFTMVRMQRGKQEDYEDPTHLVLDDWR